MTKIALAVASDSAPAAAPGLPGERRGLRGWRRRRVRARHAALQQVAAQPFDLALHLAGPNQIPRPSLAEVCLPDAW